MGSFANISITRKLFLHAIIAALFLLIVISITVWTGNTLTMITAIARFERTHTVSRVESMVALMKFLEHQDPGELEKFHEKIAITQSYNKVFSRLLEMRKNTPENEFIQILETTFKEADHKTAVIIVNRMKILHWHPFVQELVANAVAANAEGEKLKNQVTQIVAAKNEGERKAIFAEIEKTENEFILQETSFSKRCSDLANEVSTYVSAISIILLILCVGFIGFLTYLIAKTLLNQAVAYASNLEKEVRERKQAEESLLKSQTLYRNLVEGTPDLITRVDTQGRMLFINHAALNLLGLKPEECIGRPAFDVVHPDDREATQKAFSDWLQSGKTFFTYENRLIGTQPQEPIHVTWTICAEHDENGNITGFASTARDITYQKHSEEEKSKLEEQLQQTQKMESVGRLAGGVAHDFNNMLGVILGHASLALTVTDPKQPLYASLEEIRKAAERSAGLTRQLLAFARKQTIAPKVLDLNETVSGMLKMLQRIIGEDIQFTWQPAANLWPVSIDPSQIDQILANLCVNARDSIAGVGKISIETGNRVIDENYATHNVDSKPGDYVTLSVSDTGCGIDKETASHIFEPFFTTKGVGQGTGLGLATVYGAVKQNNGFIDLTSELGVGSKFTIYLPRYSGKIKKSTEGTTKPIQDGNETILLVEDEPALLNMVSTILTHRGYTILPAPTPDEAARLARENGSKIHLLLTDVIMPTMNGPDLAKSLRSQNPHLKCLFMSGYTADVIAHHGVLSDGTHFIQKPFSPTDLATKVRKVLDT